MVFKLTVSLSGFPDHTDYFQAMYGETSVWGVLVVGFLFHGLGSDEEKEEEEISKET